MARLVFCEDQEQIRKLIALAMRVTTHTIEVTANGREGLAAIERTVPDLVVTDLRMPDMDGFALADALRAREPCATYRSCSSPLPSSGARSRSSAHMEPQTTSRNRLVPLRCARRSTNS